MAGEKNVDYQPDLTDNVDSYLSLLVLIHLIDNNNTDMAVKCATNLMAKIESQNRRTMDMISSKCYLYYIGSFELVNKLAETRTIHHSRLRTATLRDDFEGQAVLINCLLRNYLHYNLYNQADKLVLKSTFPE
jgi:26S proteasome regulatory subunit N3